jgi:hypothetical protein
MSRRTDIKADADSEETMRASRGAFIHRGAVATGGVLAAAVVGGGSSDVAARVASLGQDVRILNFLLFLERLQVDFYERATQSGALHGELLRFARVVGGQERAHVRFLERTLGSAAEAKPKADFGASTEQRNAFVDSAVELEESASGAYIAQAPNLTRTYIASLAGLTAVEARQTAWIRSIAGAVPAPAAADAAKTEDQVRSAFTERGWSIERG